MAPRSFLSKSTFIRGIQCEKSFYLHKKRPFLRDRISEKQLAKFSRGHKVGIIARDLYPGGIDVSPRSHFQMNAAIKKTAELIREEVPVIYEASFEYQGVRVALDILYREDDMWKAVEIKSSAAISETYLWDASLQYYVITGSGLPLADFSLGYINYGYVREGELSLEKLFVVESVLELVQRKQQAVDLHVEKLRQVNQLTSSPEVSIGPQCTDPYACDFIGHCWKKTGTRPDVMKLVRDQYVSEEIKHKLHEPLGLFSSLSFKPALPPYNGCSPYQNLAYSFGLVSDASNGNDHFICLAEPGSPFKHTEIEALINQLMAYSSIVVFEKETEADLLLHACGDDPALKKKVIAIAVRMVSIKPAYLKQNNLLSENHLPQNADEVLAALHLEALGYQGQIKSQLASSVRYGDMSENGTDPSGLVDIKAFHAESLARLEQLFRHTINS